MSSSPRTPLLPRTVALVVAVLLSVLVAPTASARPHQPTVPTPHPPPTSTTAPRVAKAASVIRILSPTPQTLVSGRPLVIKIWTTAKASHLDVRLDDGSVTQAFRRSDGVWVARLNRVPAGTNTVEASARLGTTTYHASSFITVQGPTRSLITVLPPDTGTLRWARDGGVEPVALRLDPKASVDARLNGHRVVLGDPMAGNVRTTLLSLSDGLQRGTNSLAVQAWLPDGGWQRITHAFTIAAGIPLAEAAGVRRVRMGDQIKLDARASLAGTRGNPLSYQWRVLHGPPGTTLGLPARSASSAQSTFTLPAPGRYVLGLTVNEQTGNGRTLRSTDLTDVSVLAPAPPLGQRITTFANDPSGKSGSQGLQVGTSWIDWNTYFHGAKAGVYFLDQRSLTFPLGTDQQQVSPVALPGASIDEALKKAFDKVPAGTIAVVVGEDGCCAGSRLLPASGRFSHIVAYDGNPDDVTTNGTWNKNMQTADGTGPAGPPGVLSGYLRYQVGGPDAGGSSDSNGSFRFVQDDSIRYSTAEPSVATGAVNDGAVYRLTAPVDDATSPGQAISGLSKAGPLTLGRRSDDDAQQWQLVRAYGAYYKIRNRATGLCVDVNGGGAVSATIGQYTCDLNSHDQLNQLWAATWDSDSEAYTISSATSLDPRAAKVLTRRGSSLVIADPSAGQVGQRWNLDIPPGVYTISAANAQLISEPDYTRSWGTPLVTASGRGELRQQWQLIDKTNDGSFALRNVASGLCMDVRGGGTPAAGAVVDRYPCDPNSANQANQRWVPVQTDKGMYLQAVGTTLFLGADTNHSLRLQTYNKFDHPNVQPVWALNRSHPAAAGGGYALSLADGTGRTATAVTSGQARIGAATAPAAGQDWQLRDGGNQTVKLQSRRTGECLTRLSDPDTDESIAVHTGNCDAAHTTWRVRPVHGDVITLESTAGNTRVLTGHPDSSLSAETDGQAPVQQWVLAGRTVAFGIADRDYSTSLPSGGSGFAVMATDRSTNPVPGYPATYVTNGPSGTTSDQQRMAGDLARLAGTPGTTVLVQSVGRPKPTSGAWNDLADALHSLGANRSEVLGLDGSGDYAFAGCAGCGPTPSYDEVIQHSSTTLPGARLEGTLSRDDDGTLVPQRGTSTRVDNTFFDLSARASTPWPFGATDDKAHRAVLTVIAAKLGLRANGTCNDPELDPVRNNYCVIGSTTQVPSWSAELTTLNQISLADVQNKDTDVSPGDLDEVRRQVAAEFGELDKVHAMMTERRETYQQNIYGSQASANDVAASIKAMIPARTSGSNALGVTGGVLGLLETTFSLAKTLYPFLILAGPAPKAGASGPEKFPTGDAVENTLGLVASIVELAAEVDDDSTEGVAADISAEAFAYAASFQASNAQVIANMSTVENVILSDPVKLGIAASNSSQGWSYASNADAQQAAAQLTAGFKRDLWVKLFPDVFEMWQWPTINTGNAVTDIACLNNLTWVGNKYHYIYTGQDPRGIFTPIVTLNGNGTPGDRYTVVLTYPKEPTNLGDDANRVLQSQYLDAFLSNTGYQPAELPEVFADNGHWRNFPHDMETGSDQCVLRNRATGTVSHFGPRHY